MSVVMHTCVFHRPITMKSHKSQSSSHFTTFPKEFHFQRKASQFSMKSNKTIFSNHINSIHPKFRKNWCFCTFSKIQIQFTKNQVQFDSNDVPVGLSV